jgi:exportin-2 (importin alpha re-exporter)
VLAQLLEARDGLSPAYEGLFPPLLTPTMWERPGNVPPLVRLLCAYTAKGKPLVLSKLEMVLGIFQKLLARGATDAHAARLLSALWRACDLSELSQYLIPIFDLCIRRAQGYKKVGPALVATWSVFVARYGAPALRAQLEGVQPGLAAMVLRGLWAEYAPHVKGVVERKAAVLGCVRLVAEVPEVAADYGTAAALLSAACGMVLADAGVVVAEPEAYEEDDGIDVEGAAGGAGGYNAAFVQLSFAAEAEADLYSEYARPVDQAQALAQLFARQPALLQAVAERMPADKQQEMEKLMAAAA